MVLLKFPADSLSTKLTNEKIKVTTDCIDTFRGVQRILSNHKINFHAFFLRERKLHKVLLRGLPSSFIEQSIKEELATQGFEITYIRQFLKEGRKLSMFMVTLPNSVKNKEIFQLQLLFYIVIREEAYKTTGPAQCFTCQDFKYSSVNCGHTPRCVKCGNNHLTKECHKTPDQPPKCCNCRE